MSDGEPEELALGDVIRVGSSKATAVVVSLIGWNDGRVAIQYGDGSGEGSVHGLDPKTEKYKIVRKAISDPLLAMRARARWWYAMFGPESGAIAKEMVALAEIVVHQVRAHTFLTAAEITSECSQEQACKRLLYRFKQSQAMADKK